MPPDDPLGRHGPSLDNFLRKTPIKPAHQMQPCPYGKKCTYGNKCKYSHPERSKHRKPTSELLLEQDQRRKEQKILQELQSRKMGPNPIMPWERGDGVLGGDMEPLGNPASRGTRSSPVSHQESAGTWPLMNHSMTDNNMSTVPLSSTQHAQLNHRHGQEDILRAGAYGGVSVPRERTSIPNQNMHHVGERWSSVPDHRVVGYTPQHPQRLPPAGRQSMPHNVLPQQHPTRSSMTAPLLGYAPPAQPPTRDMMTAPLTERDYQHQAAHQLGMGGGKRFYHQPRPRESQPPVLSGQYHRTRDPREHIDPNLIPSLAQDFQTLGLREPRWALATLLIHF